MKTNKQVCHDRTQHQHGQTNNFPRPTDAHKRDDTRTTQKWKEKGDQAARIVTPPAKKTSPKTVATLTFPRFFLSLLPASDPSPRKAFLTYKINLKDQSIP